MLGQEEEPSASGLEGASSHQDADTHQADLAASDLEGASAHQELEPLQTESIPSELTWTANPAHFQGNKEPTQTVGRRPRSNGSIMQRPLPAHKTLTPTPLEPLPIQPCKRQPSYSQGRAEKILSSTSAFYQPESSGLQPSERQVESVSASSSAPAILSSSPGGIKRTASFPDALKTITDMSFQQQQALQESGGKLPLSKDTAVHDHKKITEANFIEMLSNCMIQRQKNEVERLVVSRGVGLIRDVSQFLLKENAEGNIRLNKDRTKLLSLLRSSVEDKHKLVVHIYAYLLTTIMFSFIDKYIDNEKDCNKDSITYVWYFNQLVANTAMVNKNVDELYKKKLNKKNEIDKLIKPNTEDEYKIYYCILTDAGAKLMEDFCIFEANKLRAEMKQARKSMSSEENVISMHQTTSSENVSDPQQEKQNEAELILLNPLEGNLEIDVGAVPISEPSLSTQSSDESSVSSQDMNPEINLEEENTTACLLMQRDSAILSGPLPSSFAALDPPENQLSPRSAYLGKLLAFALTRQLLDANPALFSTPVSSPRTGGQVSSSSSPRTDGQVSSSNSSGASFFQAVVAKKNRARMQELKYALETHRRRSLSF